MSEALSKKKRKYFDNGGGKNKWRKYGASNGRPKRGAPGMMLTCETGRELKCMREGLEILNFYLSATDEAEASENQVDGEEYNESTELSLEEELKRLKSKKGSSETSGFGEFNTNCRGIVFVLCTLPGCNLIPAIQTEYMLKKRNGTETNAEESNDEVSNKKLKSEKDATIENKNSEENNIKMVKDGANDNSNQSPCETPPWDPISTLRTIMSDIDNDSNKEAPRSRFVTRMIPIQATCFASPEELQLTCSGLLKKYMVSTTKTFAITFKRRNCSNLNRNLVIKIVGDLVSQMFPKCKVNLSTPDVTIVVEVCGTLCGVSVVANAQDFRKFNLIGSSTTGD